MGFNGSGLFVRVYNWVTDRNNGVKIRADRFDAEMDGMATGLSTCITKDGQTIITANIPMNSKKFTGLADGTASGNSVHFGQIREKLAADRAYYVRTNGSDSNTGLANTAGGAFLTIQKAQAVIWESIDTNGYNVTVHVADGTYTNGVFFTGPHVGGGTITFTGNTTTPSNVLIDGTSGSYGFYLSNGASLTISGFKIQSAIENIHAMTGANLIASSLVFGVGQDIQVEGGAYFEYNGNLTISGDKAAHVHATRGGKVYFRNGTCTVSGTPAFSSFFAGGSENSFIDYESFTYSGGATGLRFFFHIGVAVRLNSAYSATFFPGNVAGTLGGAGTIENVFGSIQSVDTTDAISTATGSIITAGGIGVAKDIFWGGAAPTAFSPTFTSSGGSLGSSYTINSASFKDFGKLTVFRARATFTSIGTGSGRLIMTTPTTVTLGAAGQVTIALESNGKGGIGKVSYDANNTASFTLADGTFPVTNGDIAELSGWYFKD